MSTHSQDIKHHLVNKQESETNSEAILRRLSEVLIQRYRSFIIIIIIIIKKQKPSLVWCVEIAVKM